MKLTIGQRLILPNIFAANKSTLTEAAVRKTIKDKISFSAEEAESVGLTVKNGVPGWDGSKDAEKEFYFTREQMIYMRESVMNLSRSPEHDVTDLLLPLCEKIMTY
jgi:hypothetical protein